MNDRSPWSRAFGFGAPNERAQADQSEWDSLTDEADSCGVQWADLVQDGYRVAGDLVVGGVTVRYDWRWRIDELRRRIRSQREREY